VQRSSVPRRSRLPVVAELSAGGLVVDRRVPLQRRDELPVALIARRTRTGDLEWILPKGHLEHGESTEEAAVREVEEETGIRSRVIEPLGTIQYWFVYSGHRVHKTVHHFLLDAVGGQLSSSDIEVDQVEWVPLREAPHRMRYADERDLVEQAAERVAEAG
jgi:8-oxo-dGTP pyrophosphatase MutT (NUDIX family)